VGCFVLADQWPHGALAVVARGETDRLDRLRQSTDAD
jgi:hypothetical protein